ncbi:MAG: S8/S53 family peptidase, partial [Rickettsiales bacterium]|nr:S8/S53 family peptidase [Rickettsiales bacterium]
MASKKLAWLLGAMPVLVPGHEPPANLRVPQPWVAQVTPNRGNLPPDKEPPPTKAQSFFKHHTDAFNPRFAQYEEKSPVIAVVEADTGDHKAEVARVIESAYGTDNKPRIVYIDSNLLSEGGAFTLGALLKREGVSLSSVRAMNFSMSAWSDSTSPSAMLAMRSNIMNFNNTIFVHGAGNLAGVQPVFGLTTQSDHAIVVGSAEHGANEAPLHKIKQSDFSAGTEFPCSSVDLVMKGRNVPIDGISGRLSKDKKDNLAPREISGTSFSTPQVTALAAKLSARYRDMFINGLPGRRYKDELTQESLVAKDRRREAVADTVTVSILQSAGSIDPGDRGAVLATPGKRSFDTKGSGFGMPHFGLAERILFDQLMAAQLEGRVIPVEDYQAFAPESTRVFPRTPFKTAQEEHAAAAGDLMRHNLAVRVPVPLQTKLVPGEKNTLSIDIPPFGNNFSARMLRGSLLFATEEKGAPGAPTPHYELFIESPDRKTRIPLGGFTCEQKQLWHTDRAHPIDDYRLVNFRTRACAEGHTAPTGEKTGWRFIIKTTHKDPKDVKVFASGEKALPVLELTGVPEDREIFKHH